MSRDVLVRQAAQTLYRYLPKQVFAWAGPDTAIGLPPAVATTLDVPAPWVKLPLLRLLRPFTAAESGDGAGSILDIIDAGQYTLVEPVQLSAERFPTTWLCRVCDRFTRAAVGSGAPRCADGHPPATSVQFSWVHVHECGAMFEMSPPRCPRGCNAAARLRGGPLSGGRQAGWRWQCTGCTTVIGGVYRGCTSCGSGQAGVTRATQSTTFSPQSITVLNPPSVADFGVVASEHANAAAIAQQLGLLEPGMAGLRAADAPPAAELDEQTATLLATLGLSEGDPAYDEVIARARARAGQDDPADWRAAVDALGLGEDERVEIGHECIQLSLAAEAGAVTVADLRADAADGRLAARYDRYDELCERFGIVDTTLLRNLPMAHIVAGFTRMKSKADDRVKFTFFDAERGKFPMYGLRTETEGLLVRLDVVRVVAWLEAAGLAEAGMTAGFADPTDRTADPDAAAAAQIAARRWLLTRMEPVRDIFNPPAQRISAAVLGLVHSVAHRLMKALGSRSGLSVDSLAEYLFPVNAAFLIYANARSDDTLGGLEHTFRYDLHDCLAELDAERRCVFDPPCRTHFGAHGGACAACLYVAEISCARFNSALSRNYLFGSAPTVTFAGGAPTTAAPPPTPAPPAPPAAASGAAAAGAGTAAPPPAAVPLDEVVWSAYWPR